MVTEDILKEHLLECDGFITAKKPENRHNNIGFVDFASLDSGQRAMIKLNGRELLGKKLDIKISDRDRSLSNQSETTGQSRAHNKR